MVRAAYCLGGLGSGLCDNKSQLIDLCTKVISIDIIYIYICIIYVSYITCIW